MARRRPKGAAKEERGLIFGLSPNQVVAYNLARARELKGWTQDQAAEALEPYLGVLWSKASLSQAERSVAGRVVRNFSADEIVAFARAFELPVTWFFMPPPAWAGPGMPTRLDVPDAPALGETVALLVDLVFGDKAQQAMLAVRLDAFLGEAGAGVLTAAQSRITALGRHKVEALVRQSFQDLGRWQTSLRALANQLEDLEVRAKRAVAADLGVDTRALDPPRGENLLRVDDQEGLEGLEGDIAAAAGEEAPLGTEVEDNESARPGVSKQGTATTEKAAKRRNR